MSVDVEADTVVELLKAVAEPLRWQILELLAEEELCVCHLVEELEVKQPLVSHHLRILRDVGLVATSRYRYWTYYRLVPETLARLGEAVDKIVAADVGNSERRRPCS